MSERTGRYAVKVDANQREIVHALTEAGYQVFDTHTVGHGFPDLCVQARSGAILLFEVKGEKCRLTPDEVAFFMAWRGAPVYMVRTAAEAVGLCEVL